ncbi:MAG: ABC transporter permease [Tannerellaceae bacterium]|jgi:ABC-2 type transport system permease protein|nr:ABC transporter permease [Tannerellaceae bacterium]
MNKLSIIIKREYLRRVSKKSFILLTLLMPFLFAATIFFPLMMSRIKSTDTRTVAIIDTTGKYAPLFTDTDTYKFINSPQTLEDYRNAHDKAVFAILSITSDLLNNPNAAALYSEKQIPADLSTLVDNTLRKYVQDEKLATYNIPNIKEIIADSKVHINIQTIKWEADGAENISSTMIAKLVGFAFTLIIYMFIVIYGAMVMNGVQEEKTNRIVEIMVSSVRPFDLMMGKIVGIALVGLTQAFIWATMAGALLVGANLITAPAIDPAAIQQSAAAINQTGIQPAVAIDMQQASETAQFLQTLNTINLTEITVCFILYFIGGYLLFAALFAAIGAAINQPEDSQQFMMPIMLLLLFSLYAGMYSLDNPDGPLAAWCSFIPITSPVVMMMRLPFDVPLWQQIISIVTLYATAIGITWLSAKIYRVGILMYGKKPTVKELIKWIKYK